MAHYGRFVGPKALDARGPTAWSVPQNGDGDGPKSLLTKSSSGYSLTRTELSLVPCGGGGRVSLRIDRDPTTQAISVTGEIDLSSVQDLEDCLECEPPARDVTLDFSGVSFMDSTGINVLIRAIRRLRSGHTLRLVRPQATVRRVLEICGLDAFPGFEIVDSVA